MNRYSRRGDSDRSFGRRGQVRLRVGGRYWTGTAVHSLLVDRRGRILVAGVAYDPDTELREDYGHPHALIARLRA